MTSHYCLLEDSSPLFIVFELVEARASRRQKHHVAGDCLAPRRVMHATLEGARVGNAL